MPSRQQQNHMGCPWYRSVSAHPTGGAASNRFGGSQGADFPKPLFNVRDSPDEEYDIPFLLTASTPSLRSRRGWLKIGVSRWKPNLNNATAALKDFLGQGEVWAAAEGRTVHLKIWPLPLDNSPHDILKIYIHILSENPLRGVQICAGSVAMDIVMHLKREFSRQFSRDSPRQSSQKISSGRQSYGETNGNLRTEYRFSFGRQSSLDPNKREDENGDRFSSGHLSVPEQLDATIQLLFLASRGDVKGVESLLNDGVDPNNADFDDRTALHVASCEGHVEVVKLLLKRGANVNARDRWGSTVKVVSPCLCGSQRKDNERDPRILELMGTLVSGGGIFWDFCSVGHTVDVASFELNSFGQPSM